MKNLLTALIIFLACHLLAQTEKSIEGVYGDEITTLHLKTDHTFTLITPDYIFPYTYRSYTNTGTWKQVEKKIILNPDLEPRQPEIAITEKSIPGEDSITFIIRYKTRIFENNQFQKEEIFNFETLTLYLDKKRNYHHLVRKPVVKHCSFTRKVKNQIVVDTSNTFCITRNAYSRIGLFSYGFPRPMEFQIRDPNANLFEIEIIQPLDVERMPRSKEVMIVGKYVNFYEYAGKIRKSFTPLKRTNVRL